MSKYRMLRAVFFTLMATGLAVGSAIAQETFGSSSPRPPATPLITHDPYFSIWSATDTLTDQNTSHWTGHPQPLTGLVCIDAKAFRIMGRDPENIPAMQQASLEMTPLHTRYRFTGAGVEIELSFFTPAFLDDLDLLSRPVTYVTWTCHSLDAASHDVSVYLDADATSATSYDHQPVTFSREQTASGQAISVGSRDQSVLNRSGDDLRIDWGYFHLWVPTSETSQSCDRLTRFVRRIRASTGALPKAGLHGWRCSQRSLRASSWRL